MYRRTMRKQYLRLGYELIVSKVPPDPTLHFLGKYREKPIILTVLSGVWVWKELGKTELFKWLLLYVL